MLLRESVQQGQKVSQLVVPEKFQTDMLRAYHDDLGHQGRACTLSIMTTILAWYGCFCRPKDQRIRKMHRQKGFTSKSI